MRDGYDAVTTRRKVEEKGEEQYLTDVTTGKTWRVQKAFFENLDAVTSPVKEHYEVEINEHASLGGRNIYLSPFIMAQMEANPFKLEKREYPVDYGSPQESLYLIKITLPEGYAVDELPPSKAFMLPQNAGRYSYNATKNGNTVSIVSSFQINKSLFVQDEYLPLREFYNQVIAKQSEQLVLKKTD